MKNNTRNFRNAYYSSSSSVTMNNFPLSEVVLQPCVASESHLQLAKCLLNDYMCLSVGCRVRWVIFWVQHNQIWQEGASSVTWREWHMTRQGWRPLLYAHPVMSTILTQEPFSALGPGSQQVILARCSNDLGGMDAMKMPWWLQMAWTCLL